MGCTSTLKPHLHGADWQKHLPYNRHHQQAKRVKCLAQERNDCDVEWVLEMETHW